MCAGTESGNDGCVLRRYGYVFKTGKAGMRLQGSAGLERCGDPGKRFNVSNKARVESDTQVREESEVGRILRVSGGEHPGGGDACMRERKVAFEYSDVCAATVQFERKREADDPCSDDRDVRVLHTPSLDGHGKDIVCVIR